jgi:hypothetical protein
MATGKTDKQLLETFMEESGLDVDDIIKAIDIDDIVNALGTNKIIEALEVDGDDTLELLFESVRKKGKWHVNSLTSTLCDEMASEGYIIYKPDTQKESMQIIEAIQAIAPGYRDQESKLFYEK